ncbi:hypothetical protein HU200_066371 [Digitaria exilis]|uniref:NB-ARC domain-containing protein n=1 Tax=Digitaria exilis TaxID=1010633 RepID=A0A835DU11_9POAL|nr:hypothetical protein HU200_066371 [Digitaria exilis]
MKLENCSCSADLQTSCIDGDGCMSLNQGYSQELYLSGRLFVDNEGIRKVKDAEHVWFVTDFPRHVHMCMTNPLQHPFGGRLLFRANCSFSSPPAALSSSRENPEMEIFLSAALGELTTRSINFFISKFTRPQALDMEDRLRWVLLRARVIEDEAMGRTITNQAMLHQLDILRESIYRGYFKLDGFRYQYHYDEEESNDLSVSYHSLYSKLNYVKDFCFSSGTSTYISEDLQEVHDSLSSMIIGSNELVMFLKNYPRMYRQPYSMHLLLGNCIFGRQRETELVIDFLLGTKPHSGEELEVLPIVGPGRVGKSTLVAHVSKDERVRDHFSQIIFLSDHDLKCEKVSLLAEECAMECQNCALNKDGRLLIVIEIAGDLTEDAWNKLCSASKRHATNSTKIIITSRSDKIMKLGTTGGVTLKYPPKEAYWYFFKTLTFQGMDPEDHPRLASLAMKIAMTLNGSLIVGNKDARLLRDNFDQNFWLKVLAFKRRITQKSFSKFGMHPSDLLDHSRLTHLGRIHGASETLIVYDEYQCSSEEVVPDIKMADVAYGSVKPHGKFEALAWRSRIPPYYNYVYVCEIRQELKTSAAKRKSSMRNGITLC